MEDSLSFLHGRLPVSCSAHQTSSEKGSAIKGKNLLSRGAFFFFFFFFFRNFIIYPFSEGKQNNLERVFSPKSVSIPLKVITI